MNNLERVRASFENTVRWKWKGSRYWPDTLHDRNTLKLNAISTSPCRSPDEVVERMANSGLLWAVTEGVAI